MFDIGWSEMAVIALIALIVIGPKELPQAMRAASKWVRKARALAREFQSGVDEMIREADLEDARKAVESTRSFNIDKALEETVDPTGSVRDEAQDLDRVARETGKDTGKETNSDASPPDTGGNGAAETDDGPNVIEQPLRIAPAHSVTPPPPEGEAAAPATDDHAKPKTA